MNIQAMVDKISGNENIMSQMRWEEDIPSSTINASHSPNLRSHLPSHPAKPTSTWHSSLPSPSATPFHCAAAIVAYTSLMNA